MTAYSLPGDFWTRFAREDWERRPRRFERALPAPLAAPAEVFAVLAEACRRFQPTGDAVSARFYVEHALQQAEIPAYLPAPADASAEGYAARVGARLGGRRFGLVVNRYHVHDAQMWLRLREFLSGLFARVGPPPGLADAVAFLGNYAKTPFGVHRDAASNFTFVVAGRKRVRLWSPEAWPGDAASASRLDYETALGDAVTLDGEPGDVLYWPSSHWHVAECPDGLALTLSVPLYLDSRPDTDLLRPVAELVSRRLADAGRPAGRRPAGLARAVRRARAALGAASRDRRVEELTRIAWLTRQTSGGFQGVPPPLPPGPLDDGATVTGDPRFPVRWLPARGHEVVCAANGHAFGIAAHPRILRLLARLNRGEAGRVKDLVEAHAGRVTRGEVVYEASPDHIRALLAKLRSLRALTVVD